MNIVIVAAAVRCFRLVWPVFTRQTWRVGEVRGHPALASSAWSEMSMS